MIFSYLLFLSPKISTFHRIGRYFEITLKIVWKISLKMVFDIGLIYFFTNFWKIAMFKQLNEQNFKKISTFWSWLDKSGYWRVISGYSRVITWSRNTISLKMFLISFIDFLKIAIFCSINCTKISKLYKSPFFAISPKISAYKEDDFFISLIP